MADQRARQIRKSAIRFLALDAVANPHDANEALLDRAAAHLRDTFGLGLDASFVAAVEALAEIEGGRTRCRFEVDRASPHLVWMLDTVTNRRLPVTTGDVLRLMGPREAAA